MSESKKALHKVEDRLTYLYTLKSPYIPKQREYREKYQWIRRENKHPYKSDYKTNTTFSIVNAKAAELLTWLQEYDFIPLDDDWIKYVNVIKKIWSYEWLNTKTDKQIAKVIYSALKYWDWFMYEWYRKIKRKIKNPILVWDKLIEEEKEIIDYDWIFCEYIPWEDIYFDWTNIDNSNECIWIKHWDRTAFINSFSLNPNYKNINEQLPIWKYYYVATDNSLDIQWNFNDREIISELRYYNKSQDKFIILANWVEVYNSCIPYKHKELPFCKFEDYFSEDRFYSMWEFEILEEDENFKDALRSLAIDVIKAQFWFTTVNPDADFDENTIEVWPNKFARLNPEDVRHFAPNISANTVMQTEEKVDNDIIIKTWIDFRSQILWPNETATKTASKTQSWRKRINLNLKLNGYSFFERLARLRMSNIEMLYSTWDRKIPTKWVDVSDDWVETPLAWWYGNFLIKPEYVKGKFNIIPITESILWISTEREKTKLLEYAQVVWNMIWLDWKPIINPSKLAEKITSKFWLPFDELSEQQQVYKSPNDMLKEVDNEDDWISNDSNNQLSPDYIPPEQRSWNTTNVPLIWGLTWGAWQI